MTDTDSPSFAFCLESDAYSTAGKIMGRQVAGQGFLRGLGKTWPKARLRGVRTGPFDRDEVLKTLRLSGFRGELRLTGAPEFKGACAAGALYYPTIPGPELARFRNRIAPAAFSVFGVTHTISSDRALDTIAALATTPFMPWDALICTSPAAKQVVDSILSETQDDLRRDAGVTRFETLQTPVIPLGVDCDSWTPSPGAKARARASLGLANDEVAFLFAGRLSFHAKANPAPLYQALQGISGGRKLVLIEAGLFPNDSVYQVFLEAQAQLAPDVRFVHASGDNAQRYADAWRAADVFVSLSDNVQETFGLTPVEAMAAGLPVVVSDWSGYRSTVRHGTDGFVVPTIALPPGAGGDLGLAVESGVLSYDRQIGLLSLGVTVDRRALQDALTKLAGDPALRAQMGAAGRRRAREAFDWPVVLRAYDALAGDLAVLRVAGSDRPARPWRERADPFGRFEGFASRTIGDDEIVTPASGAQTLLSQVETLGVASFSFHPDFLDQTALSQLLCALEASSEPMTVEVLLRAVGGATPDARRALAWLFKFGVVEIGLP
jgi:glycosyltransferase involved in cell wall biosynthesis